MKSKKIGMQALKIANRKQSGDLHSQSVWTEVFTGCRKCCTSYNGDYKVENCQIIGSEGCNIYNFSTYGTYHILSSKIRMDGIWYLCVFVVIIAEMLGWGATISVNALIGMHFLEVRDFEFDFIANEFMLVLIGITMALVLNLFYDYGSQRKALVENMRYTEERLQMILGEISAYLANKEMQRNVWDDICALEKEVQGFIQDAYEYQDNTFQSHPGYYIDYFEMRMKQCNVIHNLHYEMKKIRHMPDEAMIISSYVFDMLVCVKEYTVPTAQLDELHELFAIIRKNPLPKTREEFESRAMLYHILMDLEEFLVFKRRFVDGLDDKKRKLYWDN